MGNGCKKEIFELVTSNQLDLKRQKNAQEQLPFFDHFYPEFLRLQSSNSFQRKRYSKRSSFAF